MWDIILEFMIRLNSVDIAILDGTVLTSEVHSAEVASSLQARNALDHLHEVVLQLRSRYDIRALTQDAQEASLA